jgi:uncharacterized Tic20 family protein
MNNKPATEDRIWAALSHLSALTLGMGIVLPIIGWADQRRKSNYASLQCLQALGYQSLGFTVWILCTLVMIILGSIISLAVPGVTRESSLNTGGQLGWWLALFLIIVLGLFALYFGLPLIAAVTCALGRDFRYPILGDRLARYLRYDSARTSDNQRWLAEDSEFRWVAAMGHFSILIMLWGMLAPLTAWMVQGKQSPFLKFQSIQTLVYQAVTTTIYLIGGFLYFIGFVLLIFVIVVVGESGSFSSMGMVSILLLGVPLLISFVLILLVPLLHILGQWAGYRVLKGDSYHYPLVGGLVNKWISKNSATEEKLT